MPFDPRKEYFRGGNNLLVPCVLKPPEFVVVPFDNDSVWVTINVGLWEGADKLKVLAVYKTLTNFGAFEYKNNVLDDKI